MSSKKKSPDSYLIICEGEGEIEFLKNIKMKGMFKEKYGNPTIKLFKSWGWLRRIRAIEKGFDIIIFIHDTDDVSYIKDKIKLFEKSNQKIFWNNPNFDYFVAEYIGLKFNKDDNKDVLRKIKDNMKSKSGKLINYSKFIEKGDIKNIKNKSNYQIIDLINFNI